MFPYLLIEKIRLPYQGSNPCSLFFEATLIFATIVIDLVELRRAIIVSLQHECTCETPSPGGAIIRARSANELFE
jgi:hypothetical protein